MSSSKTAQPLLLETGRKSLNLNDLSGVMTKPGISLGRTSQGKRRMREFCTLKTWIVSYLIYRAHMVHLLSQLDIIQVSPDEFCHLIHPRLHYINMIDKANPYIALVFPSKALASRHEQHARLL